MKKQLFSFIFLMLTTMVFSQNILFTVDNITSSPLTGSWTVPLNVTQIRVQCWGGGGGGGGATGQAAAGGGGGGGAYTEKTIQVTPGQVFNYSVGNGGVASYSTGGTGGNSWFGSATTLLAKGGNGGMGANNACCQTASGASAVTSGNIGGTINYYGGAGGTGTYGGNGSLAGGGGGGAGSTANGSSGAGQQGGNGGAVGGGNGAWSGGVGCNCFGFQGSAAGGGGSGGQASGVLDCASGAGGGGRIIISYVIAGIGGRIFSDQNQNCIDNSELGISGIRVLLEPNNIITETNSNGNFAFNFIPPGQYTVKIDTTRLNAINCASEYIVNYTDANTFFEVSPTGMQTTVQCTSPNISISAPSLRRCFDNRIIFVSASNQSQASSTLFDAYADIVLDPLITVNSSTLPFTLIGQNTYRFQLGNIPPSQQVDFQISTTVSCDALLGQTLCVKASLFPVESCVLDTTPTDPIDDLTNGGQLDGFPEPCLLPWDQSSLSVDGWCQGDSVYFSITNTGEPGGGDMECYSPLWVTVDGVVTYTDSVLIPGGETIVFSYFGNGQTWILNAEQHPLHPGNSHPNAHVEACGDTANWTPNIVNDFPQDDADPVVDIYCGAIIGSFDPNDKTGYPNGYTEQHYINPNQQLQYVIRFQNTGNDTAFTVVIRDTLDYDLNIFTVTPGVSSHPYEFRMYGPRVLEWTFNNILLPDSTTNLDGSNGFVTYHVEQVPDLTPGTVIHNKADIYFDFNDPITTNETWHTIYDGFFAVAGVNELDVEGTLFKVYPNPVNGQLTIEAGKMTNERYVVYDQMGKKILSGKLSFPMTTIDVTSMNHGVYFIQIGENKSDTFKIVKL
jgi:uncharacterized repeat protein (TIGR01451 family)